MHQVNVWLDDPVAEELVLMAERLGADPSLVARVLLTGAVEAERSQEKSRQNQPAEHWDEFQDGLTHEVVSVERYAETL